MPYLSRLMYKTSSNIQPEFLASSLELLTQSKGVKHNSIPLILQGFEDCRNTSCTWRFWLCNSWNCKRNRAYELKFINYFFQCYKLTVSIKSQNYQLWVNIPFKSISCSTLSSLLLMGSVPFSAMYFSRSRRSKTAPESGDTTGWSGTSLLTVKRLLENLN